MNMNRLRPPPGCKDLALWLSGVINDAIRDAHEAGLSRTECWHLLSFYARAEDGLGLGLVSRSTKEPIRIRCEDDKAAHLAATILESGGLTVIRDIDAEDTLADAARRVGLRFKFTDREQDVYDGVIRGWSNSEIASELKMDRARVKWHMHNVFAKTDTEDREGLLRVALAARTRAGADVDSGP